jgi:hypothetical protein
MNINTVDTISNDYMTRWLSNDLDEYFTFINLHYERLDFIHNKKIIILKKNHLISKEELNRKLESAVNKKFKKKMIQLFN